MSINGNYGIVYCGATGIGFGIFTVAEGALRGRDYSGGTYLGRVSELENGRLWLSLTMTVQPGAWLVQGTSEQDLPYAREINTEVPALFGDGEPQTVAVRQGDLHGAQNIG
jgi:hypothetical protein